ncbi:hypothetical protein [Actinoallomurus iriomotensis]|uniref:Uncharacterized protein n=1 Tax=Actinoallomurus iriomotensis TaxID=478107 RepID=A0A9W6SEJ2_9ACTN|nr:hypothetical protein [Actinoallomurus iriomotensis]GLY91322.1 hypothetical protein Airi02_092510 [Actinoallomurus iriomotensis]
MSELVDFSWLSGRVLRPARRGGPLLAADPRRRFRATQLVACPACRGTGAVGGYSSDPLEWEEQAWTCGDCGTYGAVAVDTPIVDRSPVPEPFTADPEGILRAEAAARTVVERLVPWDVPATDRVVWRVGGPLAKPMRSTMPHPRAEVLRRLFFQEWRSSLGTVQHDHVPGWDPASRFAARAAWHVRLNRAWRLAADRALIVPSTVGRPQVAGRSIAGLPDPFAPLIDVWALGYAFADITGDAIHLIAPPVTATDDQAGTHEM